MSATSEAEATPTTGAPTSKRDVVVIGAGFAGLYAIHRLRARGFDVHAYEAGADVGGVWFWNRYPGARVDGESLWYSYSFSEELQQEWSWSETYASQPELLSYARHVAERFELRRNITFNTRVIRAVFDEASSGWLVETDGGERIWARFVVTAVGCLSASFVPDFEGLESFAGDWYHTSRWPEERIDFTGKRVGVIGTGSTGIQAIAAVAPEAEQLLVFQRTPNFSFPCPNGPMDEQFEREWKEHYSEHRALGRTTHFGTWTGPVGERSALEVPPEERERVYEEAWGAHAVKVLLAFNDLLTNLEANETAAEFVRNKIRSTVKDPEVAELLCPKDYPLGTKRVCMDTGYYETFNRPNVRLVDVRSDPIERITDRGVKTADAEYDVDVLIFATGFDAMTGSLLALDIQGRDGLALAEAWSAGPLTYLGLSTAGFPNLFMITGPGSPSVLSSTISSIEQHVDWIAEALSHWREAGVTVVEADPAAQQNWVEHVNEVADRTLYRFANSWYLGANVPGKPRIFMPYAGGVAAYRQKCQEVAAAGYEGFRASALSDVGS